MNFGSTTPPTWLNFKWSLKKGREKKYKFRQYMEKCSLDEFN